MDANRAWKLITFISNEMPDLSAAQVLTFTHQVYNIMVFSPEAWVAEHVGEYSNPVRKIQMIKDLRDAAREAGAQTPGLKECKDLVETVLPTVTAAPAPSPVPLWSPPPLDNTCTDPMCCPQPTQDEMDAEARAEQAAEEQADIDFARYRERLAETGTWFGGGGQDEPPF